MLKKSYPITRCQVSNFKNLETILNLGYLPPVNDFKKIGTTQKESKFYPTELLYCNKSKLFQLGFVVSKDILFPKSYPYTSSTTKILRDNFLDLSTKCKKRFNLKKNDLIVDIGSNDGNLLSHFKDFSKVLGVTPEEIGKIAIKKGIPTILKYFDKNVSKFIVKKYGKAKIVTATNVFAHIDNPNLLTKNIINILEDDGIFISESHYILPLIQTIQYDTIYHEHLRYYSLQSLNYLLNKNNLYIFDAEEIGTHGGSIRVYASKKGKYRVSKNVNSIFNKEKKLLNFSEIKKFKNRVLISKLQLLDMIYNIKKRKKSISGVSAPSRASTLINYVGIDENIIDNILEIPGSYKIGKYLPGTKIPVVNENIFLFKKKKPDYLLLLSWHISAELIKNIRNKGYKGKFIIPLPKPKIV